MKCPPFSIPTYFSRALDLPSVFSDQVSALATNGKQAFMQGTSLLRRSPLLTAHVKRLKLNPTQRYSPPQKPKPLDRRGESRD